MGCYDVLIVRLVEASQSTFDVHHVVCKGFYMPSPSSRLLVIQSPARLRAQCVKKIVWQLSGGHRLHTKLISLI